jgi:hypothetical protein
MPPQFRLADPRLTLFVAGASKMLQLVASFMINEESDNLIKLTLISTNVDRQAEVLKLVAAASLIQDNTEQGVKAYVDSIRAYLSSLPMELLEAEAS